MNYKLNSIRVTGREAPEQISRTPALTISKRSKLDSFYRARENALVAGVNGVTKTSFLRGINMARNYANTSAQEHPSQELVDDVVRQFVDLLVAGGSNVRAIRTATTKAIANSVEPTSAATFTELGEIQRDCMEVMCTWRREVKFTNEQGNPKPLQQGVGAESFAALCDRAGCKNDAASVFKTLLDFGAISIDGDDKVVPETPTFLLGRAHAGGRLAVDGVLKQLGGFLQVVHRNVCSVSGEK
ncbi:MAG: hypothetical protein ACREA9_25535, partial [Pyrinomonadaceae bacterium]